MCGYAKASVTKYLDLSKVQSKELRAVATPCLDDTQIPNEDFEAKGRLNDIAAQVVLTCLYLARHNRPDTLWTVNHLARNVTKWTIADDKRLHRLISLLHHSPTCVQFGYVGDNLSDCYLTLFCDAGFAGDIDDSRSTGGWFLFLSGPRTRVPLS